MSSKTTKISATGQISGTVYSYIGGLGNAFISPFVYLKEQDDYDFEAFSTVTLEICGGSMSGLESPLAV